MPAVYLYCRFICLIDHVSIPVAKLKMQNAYVQLSNSYLHIYVVVVVVVVGSRSRFEPVITSF